MHAHLKSSGILFFSSSVAYERRPSLPHLPLFCMYNSVSSIRWSHMIHVPYIRTVYSKANDIVQITTLSCDGDVNSLIMFPRTSGSVYRWNMSTNLYLDMSGASVGSTKLCPSFLLKKKYRLAQSSMVRQKIILLWVESLCSFKFLRRGLKAS